MPQWLKDRLAGAGAFVAPTIKLLHSAYASWSWTAKVGLLAFFFGFLFGGCTCRMLHSVIDHEPPPVEQANFFDWLDLPDEVQAEIRTWPNPYFDLAAPGLVQQAEDKDAFLWLAWEKVNGRPWATHSQDGVGSCVGHGFSAAVEILTCVDILTGRPLEYKDISAAAVYALSREYGNYLGRGDGSVGAWAAKSLMRDGCLSSEEAGDDNTDGRRNALLASQWGRSGLPAHLKSIAKKYTLGTASLVRSPEEARAALTSGYPIAICSNVGFEPTRRDQDGFCRPGGSWSHCMVLAGYRKDKRGFLVINSWGPNNPIGPKTLGQPDGSFWITWDAAARILRQGESYALSSFNGYPARKIDFFVYHHQESERWFASRSLRLARYSLAP